MQRIFTNIIAYMLKSISYLMLLITTHDSKLKLTQQKRLSSIFWLQVHSALIQKNSQELCKALLFQYCSHVAYGPSPLCTCPDDDGKASVSFRHKSPIMGDYVPNYAQPQPTHSLCSAGWSWRLELEWCERKILLGWLELELELVVGVVWEEIIVALEATRPAEGSGWRRCNGKS